MIPTSMRRISSKFDMINSRFVNLRFTQVDVSCLTTTSVNSRWTSMNDLQRRDRRKPSEQVLTALRSRIALGTWSPGSQLPRIDDTAAEYGVSASLVQRVYAQLQEEGLLYSVPGQGTFVGVPLSESSPETADLLDLVDDAMGTVRELEERVSRLKRALLGERQRIERRGVQS
jgi:DNA-binding transcriptional regulator YhcF (GntR family)